MVVQHPEYARLERPKKHIVQHPGVGTLSSYYEDGVGSETSKRYRGDYNAHARGPLPLFPQLDVMPGDASAVNDAYMHNWKMDKPLKNGIDVAVLEYEHAMGVLQGYKIHNNTGFEQDELSKHPVDMGLFGFMNATLDRHTGQAPHGRHTIDEQVAQQSAAMATQHNVGDSLEARDSGLERVDNPAVNATETGSGEAYENRDTVNFNAPAMVPMDVSAVRLNETITHPEDTTVALGANQTS